MRELSFEVDLRQLERAVVGVWVRGEDGSRRVLKGNEVFIVGLSDALSYEPDADGRERWLDTGDGTARRLALTLKAVDWVAGDRVVVIVSSGTVGELAITTRKRIWVRPGMSATLRV